MAKTISILGASGYVGKLLLQTALERGYEVKVLSRNPQKLGDLVDEVELVEGNYFDEASLAKVLNCSEAVLSTIGPPFGKKFNEEAYEKALITLLDLMKARQMKRFVLISGASIKAEDEKLNFSRKFLRLIIKITAKKVLRTKQKEFETLRNSDFNWVLLRPPGILRLKKESGFYVNESKLASFKVDIGDLCEFMVDQLESNEWLQKAPVVASR